MTDLQEKISEILGSMNYSFDDLAVHLGMTTNELSQSIKEKKLELRTLEFISKELRIPLYSFFRNDDLLNANNSEEESFYVNKINKLMVDELQIENVKLRKEIENLKQQLNSCENKLKVFL